MNSATPETKSRRRISASVAASLAGVGGLAALVTGAAPAQALPPPASHSLSYAFTGAPQYFTVPPNVSSLTVTADGAAGGNGESTSINTSGGTGGSGGRVTETVSVYGGEILQIFVGSAGQNAGAPYGRGSGGDAAGGASSGGAGGYGDGNDTTTGGSGGGGGAAS